MRSWTTPEGRGPWLVVSVHDVAPVTAAATRRWASALADTGVPLPFLVIPGPWRGASFGRDGDGDGSDLATWLRSRQDGGDEISVHGWCHRADVPGRWPRKAIGAMVARGAAELWGLDRRATADRTARGLEVLARHGLAVSGATPPGWLSSRAARAGLADAGLGYVTDHVGLLDLTSGRRWWAPALCQRPASGVRRDALAGRASIEGTLEGVGRHVVGSGHRVVAAGRSVRIGVHPGDLDRPALERATVRAVERCLDAGAVPTTYAAVLRRLRTGN